MDARARCRSPACGQWICRGTRSARSHAGDPAGTVEGGAGVSWRCKGIHVHLPRRAQHGLDLATFDPWTSPKTGPSFKLSRIGVIRAVLAGFTAIALSHILGVGGPDRKVDLTREWALLPFLLVPWIGALLLLRRHRQAQRAHPDYEQTILATLRAARQRTLAAVTRTKTILVLQILSLPPGALCVWQLHAAGKVEDTEVTSLGTVLAGLILVSMACSFFPAILPPKDDPPLLVELGAVPLTKSDNHDFSRGYNQPNRCCHPGQNKTSVKPRMTRIARMTPFFLSVSSVKSVVENFPCFPDRACLFTINPSRSSTSYRRWASLDRLGSRV